jgi:LmbE family N-acetylglucosaminyl deacetylase
VSLVPGAAGVIQRPLRAVWRRRVVRRSVDVTELSARRPAVVVAPHPDDETIGCGATIARKRAVGTDVWVIVVCDGRSSHPHSEAITPDELARIRAAEVLEACRRLGVAEESVTLLGVPDESVGPDCDELADVLRRLIDEERPAEVYLPCPLDWHRDHVAVNAAARRAVDAAADPPEVLEYPVWYWAEGPWRWSSTTSRASKVAGLVTEPFARSTAPRGRLVATDGYVEAKRAALGAYRSQRTNLTGEASWATLPESWFRPFLGPWELFLEPGAS